jgi:hypothetical protein
MRQGTPRSSPLRSQQGVRGWSWLVGAAVVVVLAGCGSSNPAREAIDAAKAEAAAAEAQTHASPAEAEAEADWTCPMHPEVHAAEAGPCPKCGMPLVKAED